MLGQLAAMIGLTGCVMSKGWQIDAISLYVVLSRWIISLLLLMHVVLHYPMLLRLLFLILSLDAVSSFGEFGGCGLPVAVAVCSLFPKVIGAFNHSAPEYLRCRSVGFHSDLGSVPCHDSCYAVPHPLLCRHSLPPKLAATKTSWLLPKPASFAFMATVPDGVARRLRGSRWAVHRFLFYPTLESLVVFSASSSPFSLIPSCRLPGRHLGKTQYAD